MLSLLDFSELDLSVPLRSSSQLEVMMFASCTTCFELSASALDFLHLDLSTLLRSYSKSGFSLPAPEMTRFGSLLSLRACSQLGSVLLAMGMSRVDSSIFFLDAICVESPPLTQSHVHLGPALLALDPLRSGFFMLVQSPCHLDSFLLLLGSSCVEPVFVVSVSDNAHLGSLVFSRCLARLGLAISVLFFAHHEFLSSARSFGQLEFSVSASDMTYLGLALFLQSLSWADFLVSVPDLLHLELLSSAHSHTYSDSVTPILGLQNIGSVFTLPAIDHSHFELPLSLQSIGCLESALLICDFLRLDFSTLLRSCARAEAAMLVVQFARLAFLSPVLDTSFVGLLLLVRASG